MKGEKSKRHAEPSIFTPAKAIGAPREPGLPRKPLSPKMPSFPRKRESSSFVKYLVLSIRPPPWIPAHQGNDGEGFSSFQPFPPFSGTPPN
ncbi:MAG: hypothetical protein LBI87_10565, partial [Candidatus Accumulibacter sp.]|nr:hypothetical protein [Accumulibacter sp.]